MKKKSCAFQYAYNERGFFGSVGEITIKEDTPLITLEEAKEMWGKYLPDFKKKLSEELNPEMAIWINMKNETDYRETLAHVDRDTLVDSGGRLYANKREYIKT